MPQLPEATRKTFANLTRDKSKWFVLVGNGINRDPSLGMPSWVELLTDLLPSMMKSEALSSNKSHGITYTEIFDLAVLHRARDIEDARLAQVGRDMKMEVCGRLADPKIGKGHQQVVDFCRTNETPLLTTNYDLTFEKLVNGKSHATNPMNRRYYPWTTYFAEQKHDPPLSGFGIWHIHGSIQYPDSLRLGVNDYTGAMQRIRTEFLPFASWVFNGKSGDVPQAVKRLEGTWIEIFLTRAPIIVGLELAPYDTLLRWLLLRRAAAHFKWPIAPPAGIYVACTKDESKQGMKDFFELLNIRVITVEEYSHCYDLFA